MKRCQKSRLVQTPRWVGLLSVGFGAVLAAIAAPSAEAADIHTVVNPSRSGDLVKTIPISPRPWEQTRSVISLDPGELGTLRLGETIEAASDIELTICIRPNPNHFEPGQPCVGQYYDYDPQVRVQLVLASEETATGAAVTIPVSKVYQYECTEQPDHRNRHCVQQVPWTRKLVDEKVLALCDRCYLNLLVSVFNSAAGPDQRVVVGTSDDDKRITQGRSQINAAVFEPGDEGAPIKTFRSTDRITPRPSVVPMGTALDYDVVYSQRLSGVDRGDQLLVDARPIISNRGLPYPTHASWSIVLAHSPTATVNVNGISERIGPVGVDNGFTCTQVASGYQSPCGVKKTGIISLQDVSRPIYVNLVLGQDARGSYLQYGRWHSGDATRALSGGSMTVRRYRGTMACSTCALTRGFQPFGPESKPADPRLLKLVNDLGTVAIDRGAISCYLRRAVPNLVCDWRAAGQYGTTDPYECEMRAFYADPAWDFNLCLEQVKSWLVGLLQRRGDRDVNVYSCGQVEGGPAYWRCDWNATSAETHAFCSGSGVHAVGLAELYVPAGRWSIPQCQ